MYVLVIAQGVVASCFVTRNRSACSLDAVWGKVQSEYQCLKNQAFLDLGKKHFVRLAAERGGTCRHAWETGRPFSASHLLQLLISSFSVPSKTRDNSCKICLVKFARIGGSRSCAYSSYNESMLRRTPGHL